MNESDRTIQFYNAESTQYSQKRYEGVTISYFQFLFKTRREIFLRMIESLAKSTSPKISLFDIGCADGVVLRSLDEKFPSLFSSITGVDIAPEMVVRAAKLSPKDRFSFYVRAQEPEKRYDVVTELGVHVTDLRKEIDYVTNKLVSGGYYIYVAVDKNSLHSYFKLKRKPEVQSYFKDYLSYREVEKIISEKFNIITKVPYGIFIPKLWSLPAFARVVQPIIEKICKLFAQSFYHETIYLLRKKE